MDNVNIKKSNRIDDETFQILSKLNPDLVEKMIRNQFKIEGQKRSNTIKMRHAITWLEQHSEGLFYIKDNGKASFFDYLILFEKKEDAITFKLQWLS